MSGYVARQNEKQKPLLENFKNDDQTSRTTDTEQAQQHITTMHSKVSTLFVEALGQDLRIVSWRPGVAGMDSPVRG